MKGELALRFEDTENADRSGQPALGPFSSLRIVSDKKGTTVYGRGVKDSADRVLAVRQTGSGIRSEDKWHASDSLDDMAEDYDTIVIELFDEVASPV